MKNKYKMPLVILAAGMLIVLASSAGATRAAMVYQSAAQEVDFSTAEFSIDIEEEVDGQYQSLKTANELNFSTIKLDEKFKVGKLYPEKLRVVNNSNEKTGYSEYVRVVLRKSWYKDGKNTNLDPALIKISVAEGWWENPAESTPEQKVYYRSAPLACGETADFITGIQVDNSITTFVEMKEVEAGIVNEYLYNGEEVFIEIQADAVQTHNAKDAMYAAWGIKASFDAEDDGNITAIGDRAVQ
ncbi:MAG: hypothetical protein IKP29_04460 [Pseudobutyrivibrio sp.]|nr:hypothetical protein [Pseudobutyrivibrio sp.]